MLRCSAQWGTGQVVGKCDKTYRLLQQFSESAYKYSVKQWTQQTYFTIWREKEKKGWKAIMKFGLEDVCSEILESLGCMSFHAPFHTVGENDGDRNHWSGTIQNTACIDLHWLHASQNRSKEQHFLEWCEPQVSLANPAFPLSIFQSRKQCQCCHPTLVFDVYRQQEGKHQGQGGCPGSPCRCHKWLKLHWDC